MIPMFGYKPVRAVVVAGIAALLSGCYYMQAARGQFEVMNKRESIDDVINATETPAELSKRLELVKEVRRFSIDELGLPDNDSYRSYADIERDYVVWNVFAAPEFSLQPKRWCFPVAGCVNYRGYFSEDAARRKANQLRDDYDVAVGGIAAYSTLGRFGDPVLNTMMRWEDTDLAAVLFHELAHQVLYVKGNSGFNESFATAVEEFGVKRWLSSRDQQNELTGYRERQALHERLMKYIEQARQDLDALYATSVDAEEMRLRKKDRINQLNSDLNNELERSGRESPAWLGEGLNNARLASMNLYHGRLPEFRTLLADCDDDLECFYAEAKHLADREREASHRK